MNSLKKIVKHLLLCALTVSSTGNAFVTKWYRTYQMSGLSHAQQKQGFLLNDVQTEAEQITTIVTKRNQQALKNYLAQKKVPRIELAYPADHCFDLAFNHSKESVITKEFTQLVTTFNQYTIAITTESITALNDQQIAHIKTAYDALIKFISRNKISSYAIIKELQHKAIRENKPITSLLRNEHLLPITIAAGAICYYIIWKTYFYKSPQERKQEERIRRSKLDLTAENHLCVICDEEKKEEELELLSCKHKYCTNCLQEMIDIALKEQNSTALVCPDTKCKQPFTKEDVAYITMYNDKKIKTFERILEKERISRDPNGKNCPTRDCPYMFINNEQNPRIINCPDCAKRFCTNCLNNHASGITCAMARVQEDKETAQWQLQNTKPCPQCHARIEKSGGCERMQCKCGYQFCWDCMANWTGRHQNTCRYNPNRRGYR